MLMSEMFVPYVCNYNDLQFSIIKVIKYWWAIGVKKIQVYYNTYLLDFLPKLKFGGEKK